MAYNFAAFVALAPETGELARNTRGQVFAADDGALTSPLTVTIDGIEVTEIPVGPQGVGTPFAADEPIVLFKSSGAPAISLASLQHLADAAVAAADDAELSRIAAELAAANAAAPTDEAIRDALAAAIADPESEVSSAVDAGITDQLAARSLPIPPEQFGAVGDGVTDDTAALQAALAAGPVVQLQAGRTYVVNATVNTPADSTIRGALGATIKAGGSVARLISAGARSTLADLTLDGDGQCASDVVRMSPGADNVALSRVTITGATGGTAPPAVWIRASGAEVIDCVIDGCDNGIRADRDMVGLTITGAKIRNWTTRGIYIAGSATAHCERVTIRGCEITDLAPGGASRYPIRVEGVETNRHKNFTVSNNTVQGNGNSWTAASNPGTADQIAITHVDGLVVSDNLSIDGGDAGMTISQQVTNATISGNVILRSDSTGLYLGSAVTTYIRGVTATSNVIIDCAQNREGDRTVPAGIVADHLSNATVANNVLGNETAATLATGIEVRAAVSNLILGANIDSSLTGSLYDFDESLSVTTSGPWHTVA